MSQVTREHFDQDMVPCYAPMAMVPVRGEGCTLWDQAGHAYLDLAGGIAVNCLGHCHPVLVDAIAQQSQRLWHVSNIMTNEPALALAGKLKAHSFADRVFFCNSGAEANEAAFKLARRAAVNLYGPEKSEIIAFKQGFHGRTFFTVSVGGQACYSDGFGPKPQEIRHLPYNDLAAVSAAMSSRTCAVVVELIQGEGGVIPVDLNFLKGLRELCDRHNALLIVDEVQTGVGRTGHFYAYQATGVIPDILTSAKSLGGGFPIAAMLTTESCAKHFTPGTHGSTYGGNPLACAVANAVVDVVSEPSFLAKVQLSGAALVQALNQLNEQYHLFQTVRGQGLLVGAELNQQWQGRAGEIMAAAAQQGLLMLVAGKNVLRFTPPLIITPAEIEQAIGKLARAITELQEKAIA